MSNVIVDKNKIDILANAISAKSGEAVTMTLDEMVSAVDGIETGITPTGNINITSAGVTDVTNYATAAVPSAVMVAEPTINNNNVSDRQVSATIDANGLLTTGVSGWATINPILTDGYAESSTEIYPTISIWGTKQLTVNTSSDLTASGATVTAPAGYYASQATKSVASGTAGTPTATKGTVSNHSVSVTPSVTNTTGYITGSTKTGTAVSVSASELVSGTKSITSNGTGIDVTNYASVDVAVPSGTPNLQTKTNIDPTTSSQTIQADTGYDGLASVQINAMPSGTAGTPTATKGTVSNHSVSVTPSVTNSTGYITGSTKTGTAVTVSASELVSGSETKTANGTYDVTNLAQLVVNVSGGGSSNFTLLGTKTVGTISTTSTTDTDTGQTIVIGSSAWNNYDLIVCECSVDTQTNGRHTCSTRLAWLTGTSNVTTKNTCTFATATWNSKLSSSGTATTRSSTTAYGVYAKAGTISGTNLTLTIYQRYNSTQTGTINGSYTMRVYGCKIYDLIGG